MLLNIPLFLRLVIPIICAVLLALPFTFYDGLLPIWVALAPVLWLVCKLDRRWAILSASVFSLTWTTLAFSFLGKLVPPGMIALSIYTSLYYVTGFMLIRWLAKRGIVAGVIGSAAVWTLIEIARANIPVLYFPWLLLGHSLIFNEHLRQGADLLGVYGLTFMIVLVNGAIAFGLPVWLSEKWHATSDTNIRSAWRVVSLCAAIILGSFAYGEMRISQLSPRLKEGEPIGVIQGNVIQKLDRTYEEMERQLNEHIAMHAKLAEGIEGKKPALICWAETMVPGSLNDNDDDWSKAFRKQVSDSGIPTLAGSNFHLSGRASDESQYQNAAYFIDASGKDEFTYMKRRLVPFGEYVPFLERFPFLRFLRSVTRDQYQRGESASPIKDIAGYKIALNICVEDIHPDLARESAAAGADLLLNITNDGWFYRTFGPRSHLQAAAFRAIEIRRPMLRVTNTGRTVAIDPLGNIDMIVPEETVGIGITQPKRLFYQDGVTVASPGTMYMRMGEFGVGMLFFGLFVASIILNPLPRKSLGGNEMSVSSAAIREISAVKPDASST